MQPRTPISIPGRFSFTCGIAGAGSGWFSAFSRMLQVFRPVGFLIVAGSANPFSLRMEATISLSEKFIWQP